MREICTTRPCILTVELENPLFLQILGFRCARSHPCSSRRRHRRLQTFETVDALMQTRHRFFWKIVMRFLN